MLSALFDLDNSKTIHVSSADYTLQSGNKYSFEYSVHYSKNEKRLPYLFLEEAFDSRDKKMPLDNGYIFTKTREIAFDKMKERKDFMKRKCINQK